MDNKTYKQLYRARPGMREKLRLQAREYNNRPEVKRAHVNQRLQKRYGITLEDKERMFADQRGECAVCGDKFVSVYKAHLDHNHETGQVRGLLCSPCNSYIVHLMEHKEDLLHIAKGYLEFYEEKAWRNDK